MFPYEDISTIPAIHYDSQQLETVATYKYLGVHIDHMFTWSTHVEALVKKVKSKIYMMYRSRYCCSVAGRKLLLTALVLPYFHYCIEVWRCCNQTLAGAVEVLFRHCLRIVLGDTAFMPKLTNHLVYELTDLLPLSIEFQFRCSCLLFSILMSGGAPNMSDMFSRRPAVCCTRDSDNDFRLAVPFTRTERERVSFDWWGCLLWHRIPIDIRKSSNLGEFRRHYMQYLLGKLKSEINVCRKFYDFV
jgi:hypothetical protein